MPNTPARIANRLTANLKSFQPVLESAKARDVNESDTVIIVTDLLSAMFGYDKYSELTSEVAIRGTYCDLAANINGELQFLVEVKAIGTELKASHTRQAVEYAATEGVDWVFVTNGAAWKVYKVNFGKPIEPELVIELDLTAIDVRNEEQIDTLYLLTKEGFRKSALRDYNIQLEALSRYCVGALVLSDPVINVIRKELRRMSPDVRIGLEQVRAVLERDVLKRDVLEGDKAVDAHRRVSRKIGKAAKHKAVTESERRSEQAPVQPTAQAATNKV
jgi:hypothetical protein